MKLTVSKKALAAAIKAALPAVPTRPGLPILAGIRLEAMEAGLTVEATDLELAVRRVLGENVKIERGGSIVAPAKMLAKATAAMPGGDVRLEAQWNEDRPRLRVSSGPRTVTLEGWPTDDWPSVPDGSETEPLSSVEAAALADAFERVALCASKDEMRPILTGVALEAAQDALEVVATDSYRLGLVRIPVIGSAPHLETPPLLPARVAKALAKQLKTVREAVDIRHLGPSGDEKGTSMVCFAFDSSTWTVRTIEGEFPHWRQVMPEEDGALLEFDPEELGSALRAAASVWGGKTPPPVRLTLDRKCTLAITEPDLGTMRETLSGASFSPNGVGAIQVAFNPSYLADAIRFCGAERGRMWIRDALKAVRFDGPERTYALMPIRPR
jgi:DNA polymerase III subunit beta